MQLPSFVVVHGPDSTMKPGGGGGAAGGGGAPADWSFVQASACRPDNLLGEGAGSKGVYKLVSPVTDESFAVKLIERRALVGESKHSFEKEVRILNALRHPGVCRLMHVATDPLYHMLVIELCDDEIFTEVAQGGLSEDVARGYFAQVRGPADTPAYPPPPHLRSVLCRSPSLIRGGFAGHLGRRLLPQQGRLPPRPQAGER